MLRAMEAKRDGVIRSIGKTEARIGVAELEAAVRTEKRGDKDIDEEGINDDDDNDGKGRNSAHQVTSTKFVRPYSVPKDDGEITATFKFAREEPWGVYFEGDREALHTETTDALVIGQLRTRHCPKGVNSTIVWDIRKRQYEIRMYHHYESASYIRNQARKNGEEGSTDDTAPHPPFEWSDDVWDIIESDDAWDAIEKAIHNRILQDKEQTKIELIPPQPESARIARYNHNAHFSFDSPHAISTLDPLQDSLIRCKLRNRTEPWVGEGSMVRKPFELWIPPATGFDIDGDLMGMYGGELVPNVLNIIGTYVVSGAVPCLSTWNNRSYCPN